MIAGSNLSILAADYFKIGRAAFSIITSADKADYIITNKTAPQEEIQNLIEIGIKVLTV